MFRLLGIFIAVIFGIGLLSLAISFVYTNIWWFVGVLIILIILLIIFFVLKSKMKTSREKKLLEMKELQEEEEWDKQLRKTAKGHVRLREYIEEETEERKQNRFK